MSKPKKIENDWEVKLKKHRSDMESMLDNGATLGEVFQKFNINSRFQKDFHARFKEVYGYSLLEYKQKVREKELEKQKELAQVKKKRQDQRPDIKDCLADVILSVVIDGNNINDSLFKFKVYNQRQDINEVVQLLFDHTLLELKQDPSLVNADYVREMCRLYGEGVKITKSLKTKTQKEIKKQFRSMTDEDRRNRQLQKSILLAAIRKPKRNSVMPKLLNMQLLSVQKSNRSQLILRNLPALWFLLHLLSLRLAPL